MHNSIYDLYQYEDILCLYMNDFLHSGRRDKISLQTKQKTIITKHVQR